MVINLGTKYVNSYLIPIEEDYVLLDTGYKNSYADFLEKLKINNIEISRIKYVVLTHVHADHTGFLRELLSKTDAVLVYDDRCKKRLETGKDYVKVYISSFINYIFTQTSMLFPQTLHYFPAVFTDNYINFDKQPLAKYGIELIPLSGHTDFDLALKRGNELFVGDICMNSFLSPKHFPIWLENKYSLLASWQTILDMKDVDTICPGHGKPFKVEKLRDALNYWKTKGVYSLSRNK